MYPARHRSQITAILHTNGPVKQLIRIMHLRNSQANRTLPRRNMAIREVVDMATMRILR